MTPMGKRNCFGKTHRDLEHATLQLLQHPFDGLKYPTSGPPKTQPQTCSRSFPHPTSLTHLSPYLLLLAPIQPRTGKMLAFVQNSIACPHDITNAQSVLCNTNFPAVSPCCRMQCLLLSSQQKTLHLSAFLNDLRWWGLLKVTQHLSPITSRRLDTRHWMQLQKRRAEWSCHILCSAGHGFAEAAQRSVRLFCHKGALQTCAPFVHHSIGVARPLS